MHKQEGKVYSIILVTLVAGGLIAGGVLVYLKQQNEERTACTLEAKQCPDGSYVGRTGPNCEFAPCPTLITVDDNGLSLPPAVVQTREQILLAARARDYEALETVIANNSTEPFSFSFGASENPIDYWKDAEARGQNPLGILADLLSGTPSLQNNRYTWPSWFGTPLDELTETEWREAERFSGLTREQIEQAGDYLGYRTAIRNDGLWMFFVAGD